MDTAERVAGGELREQFPLPSGCDEGYVWTNGIRLHYVTTGRGPLVLLLHGFPEFWYSWRHQLPTLADAGMRVVALDLRGYNLSERPRSGYDVATLVEDVRGVVAAFGEPRADIVGHDWGGILAWACAIRAPDVVRRLAVLDAPHPAAILRAIRSPRQLLRSSYVAFFQLPRVPERALAGNDFALLRHMWHDAAQGQSWLSDEDVQRFIAALARPAAVLAGLAYYRQLWRGRDALVPLRLIESPALLLWGDRDPYLGVELTDGLTPWVRDLRIRRYSSAGHWLQQQMPEDVNRALVDFLA